MASVERFEDLVAWQEARLLRTELYRMTRVDELRREFDYKSQVRRAAVSIMSNIAEGFDRGGRAEFAQFLSTAKGSCAEVRSLLYVALDEEYIDQPTFNRLSAQAEEVARIIGGLRSAVARQRDELRKPRSQSSVLNPQSSSAAVPRQPDESRKPRSQSSVLNPQSSTVPEGPP